MLLTYIRTGVATRPVLGLSPLDDGRHRHHRLLLLHHLARLPARSTFTRHRGPIYFADLFHTHAHHHPPVATLPRGGFGPLRFFSDGTLAPPAPHLAKEVLPPPSTLSCPPALELNSFFWYRFGMVAHCTSLVRSRSTARPVA